MGERPDINARMDSAQFRDFYYLKEELVAFCKGNGLPTSGGKRELTERIAHFLNTGEVAAAPRAVRHCAKHAAISGDAEIEADMVCSEAHREFFKREIGKGFSFNVEFQKWLKGNAGKTYNDAIEAYHAIKENKKKSDTKIDSQFEYNTYIRDFFADNKGLSLNDAIACWRYKKGMRGHNRYEKSDLAALDAKRM